ncbi:glycosyltransferase family 39 protein [Labrys neptuniae]
MSLSSDSAPPLKATSSGLAGRVDPVTATLVLIGLSTVLRLLLAAILGLGNGESYYVASARQLSLSYYDQPPLFLWLVHALQGVSEAAWWLRLPFMAMFSLATWLMYRLGCRLFSPWAGFAAALCLNLSAVFFVSVGGWIQPDAPLMLFLLAGALCVLNALEQPFTVSSPRAWIWWLAAGLAFGLALLSKYHAVLIVAGLFVFLATTRDYRRWLFHPAPWLAAVIVVLVFVPALIWNAQHDWVSFRFQAGRSLGQAFRADWLAKNIAGQALWLTPWIWLPLLLALIAALRAGPRQWRSWFLALMAAPTILVFTATASWADVGAHFHWQAPGYLMAFPLLGEALARRARVAGRQVVRGLALSAIATACLLTLLASHAATGWLRTTPVFAGVKDPTLEGLDWWELKETAQQRGWLRRDKLFVAGTQWHQTGKIDVQLGAKLPVLCLCEDPRNLFFARNLADYAGWDAILIGQDQYFRDFDQRWRPYFSAVEPEPDIVIQRGGRAEIILHAYRARGFKPPFPSRLQPVEGGRRAL